MPTSDETEGRGRPLSRIPVRVRVLVVLATILAIDVGLSFALVPYGSSTDLILHDFYAAEPDSIDTLVVGASYAMDVNPVELDAALGSRTYSLSTYSQSLDSVLPLIRLAEKDQNLDRVILGMAFETVAHRGWASTSMALMQGRLAHESPLAWPGIVRDYVCAENFLVTGDSLGGMVPWVYNHVPLSPSAIADNIRRRIAFPEPLDAFLDAPDGGTYFGQGHFSYDIRVDLNTVVPMDPVELDEVSDVVDANIATLRQVAKHCRDRGIELYVVVVPRPDMQLVIYDGAYRKVMGRLATTVEEADGRYLDFCLAKTDWYAPLDEEFSDREHLNFQGQERFSRTLGELVGEIEAGTDVSSRFLAPSQADERLAEMDRIALVTMGIVRHDGRLWMDAEAIMPPGMDAEFEFSARSGEGEWEVLRDWGPSNRCELPADATARYTELRVQARRPGEVGPDRWRILPCSEIGPTTIVEE